MKPKRKKTGGRKPGSPNKLTKSLREMILGALHEVGGQAWLVRQAQREPKSFMALLGRILPLAEVVTIDVAATAKEIQVCMREMERLTCPPPPDQQTMREGEHFFSKQGGFLQ